MEVAKLQGRLALDDSGFRRGINRAVSGFKKIHQQSVRLNQSFELLKNTFSVFTSAIQKGWELMERGAKRVDLEATFKRLAQAQGRTADDMLAQIRRATKGTLTELESMALSTQSMMSGMAFDDVVIALQYLQRYAKATNKSFSQLTTTIMTGLARGSTLMLDDAGIIIDQTSLIAARERELGRAMSEVEKKAYLVNAAITQMKDKMGALGDSTRSAYDTMQGLKARWQDFLDTVGKYSLFAFGVVTLGWEGIIRAVQLGWANLRLGIEKHFGGIITVVRTKLMDLMLIVRDMLQRTAAALSKYDNAVARTAANMAQSMADMFNAGAVNLFDANIDQLTGATRQQLEELVRTYHEKVIEVSREIDALNALMSGNAPADTTTGGFSLAPSVGEAGTDQGNTDQIESSRRAFMDRLKRLTLNNVQYNRWALEQELADYQKMVADKIITQQQYDEYAAAAREQLRQDELRTSGSIADGWRAARKQITQDAQNAFKQGEQLAQDTFNSMSNSFQTLFVDAMKGQLKDLSDYINNFLNSILGSMMRILSNSIASSIMGSFGFGGGGGGLFGFAKGGAFVNGKVQPFASGGIVSSPTIFPMKTGMGLMGEAGKEAIMPLARASNGDLGVKAQISSAPQNMSIQIINESGHPMKAKSASVGTDMQRQILTIVMDGVSRNVEGSGDFFGKT